MMRIPKRFIRTRTLLATMIALQLVWLVTIWVTGVASSWQKLPLLLAYTVVAGVVVSLMPAGLLSRARQLGERLLRDERLLVLTLCVVVLVPGVIYVNLQPLGPDEGSLFNASKIVALEGVARFFADYAGIPWLGRQHPPLVPLIYGFTMRIFGTNLIVIRSASLLLVAATTLITYLLGSELYDRRTGFLAGGLLLSFPIFLRNGTGALTDIPVTFFFALAMFLTQHLLRTPTYRLSIAIGLVIGGGLLSKYTMVLIYPVLLSYFVTSGMFRRFKLHLGILTLASAGILATWLVYAGQIGVLTTQWATITGYAGVSLTTDGRLLGMTMWRMKYRLEALLTRLPSNWGVYNIPMLLLGGSHLIRRRCRSDLFVLLWIAIVSLLLILTLPDHRYFMPTVPALAILMARGLRRIPAAIHQAVLLALLYCGGALYLYVDWHRARHLFLR